VKIIYSIDLRLQASPDPLAHGVWVQRHVPDGRAVPHPPKLSGEKKHRDHKINSTKNVFLF
jgi:hypothetical protein